jgi:hypothetical protein
MKIRTALLVFFLVMICPLGNMYAQDKSAENSADWSPDITTFKETKWGEEASLYWPEHLITYDGDRRNSLASVGTLIAAEKVNFTSKWNLAASYVWNPNRAARTELFYLYSIEELPQSISDWPGSVGDIELASALPYLKRLPLWQGFVVLEDRMKENGHASYASMPISIYAPVAEEMPSPDKLAAYVKERIGEIMLLMTAMSRHGDWTDWYIGSREQIASAPNAGAIFVGTR